MTDIVPTMSPAWNTLVHDLRLTDDEIGVLRTLASHHREARDPDAWFDAPLPSALFRQAVDMLILSGLAERQPRRSSDPRYGWEDAWRLTAEGLEITGLLHA